MSGQPGDGKHAATEHKDADVARDPSRLGRAARAAAPHAGVLAILLALAIALMWRVWASPHPTSSVLCSCGDPGQTVWFLEWVPYAIGHGHNPFLTQAMFAGQGGANLLQSTSYLLQSFVLSPVTVLFGPTASFNVAETLAPVLSGWCMFVAARRLTGSYVGQVGAAVLWGYSPFVINAEHFGHLNFNVLFFPPLVLVCLLELCAGERRAPSSVGLWLGLLVVAQFLAGTELLAITSLTAAFGLVLAAILSPRQAWERRRRILLGLAVAAGVSAALLAYPAWMLLEGPRHIVGAPWPGLGALASEPGTIVDPGAIHASSSFTHIGGYYGQVGAGAGYIGWPLLAFVALSAVVWWQKRIGWVLLVTGAAAWLCSLGVLLLPFASDSKQWWLPWQYVQNLPLIESIGPNRFAVIILGVVALLFAVSVDRWLELAHGISRPPAKADVGAHARSRPRVSWPRKLATVTLELCLAVAISVAAIPIVASNTWPLAMHNVPTPAWFETTAMHLPSRSVLLVYPYPSSGAPDALYWQASDDMAFAVAGGRAEVPGSDGRHSEHLKPFGGTDAYLVDVSFGFTIPPAPTAQQLAQLRATLARWRVTVVVVVAFGRAPAWAGAVFTDALGRLPVEQHGGLAWYSPTADWETVPTMNVSTAAIERCSGDGYSEQSTLAAPGCVVRARPR